MRRLAIIVFGLLLSPMIFAAYVENVPQTITQPDGKVIHCLASGDEYYHWLHDYEGYTIVQNPVDGFFYYGIRTGERVVPSDFLAGTVNPANVNLVKGAKISVQLYNELRAKFDEPFKSAQGTPTHGVVNTICIYISFADDSVFTLPRQVFKEMWTATDKASVQDFYKEISYNTFDIQVHHYPVSPDTLNICYKDIYPRRYYLPKSGSNPEGYDNDAGSRERAMLKRAVEFVDNQVPESVDVDMNDDGTIDNICFVIRGEASAWATLLWPHKTGMASSNARIHGSQVGNYFLTLEKGFGAGTMCHELGHVFGAPDLYHYSNSGKEGPDAVGKWCLMCSSSDPPQSICGFLKYKYNHWIPDLPEITESGVYSLKPLSEPTNNLYKIKSPYSSSEYFVLEYRRREGRYESSVPATGLVIYRINPGAGNGNANGPPDEVYVYRPGGNLVDEGSLSSAAFAAPGRTAINDNSDPNCFLYKSGAGGKGGLNLFNISTAGDSITFEVIIEPLFPPYELNYSPGTSVVDLSWQRSYGPGLTSYSIYRNGIRYASSTQNSFRDTDLVDEQTYTYTVTAYYEGEHTGESQPSNTITYTPKPVQNLPYTENFEQINHGWKIKGNVEGFQWGNGSELEMESDNSTKFLAANSVAAGPKTVCSDYAMTPRLNLLDKTKVYLHFDYALKRWQQVDHLKIFYRKTRYELWRQIIDLPITGRVTSYTWKKYSLELPAVSYTAEAQIGFQYDDSNDFGYGGAIDNIVIDEEPTAGIEQQDLTHQIDVFPNPVSGKASLKLAIPGNPQVTMQLIDMTGKILQSRIIASSAGTLEEIDLSSFPQGMYYLSISYSDNVIVKQLIKQ